MIVTIEFNENEIAMGNTEQMTKAFMNIFDQEDGLTLYYGTKGKGRPVGVIEEVRVAKYDPIPVEVVEVDA